MDGLVSTFLRDLLPTDERQRANPDFDQPGAERRDDLFDEDEFRPFVTKPLGGILYVEDFDEPVSTGGKTGETPVSRDAGPPPDLRQAPSFSAADIAAAHEAGRLAGAATARDSEITLQGELRVAALQAVADALTASRTEVIAIAHEAADQIAKILLALLAAALPGLSARHAVEEVGSVMRAILPGLRREPTLSIAVHPDMLSSVEHELTRLWPEMAPRVLVVGEVGLAMADVTIAWGESQASRRLGDVWEQLRVALAPFLIPSTADLIQEMTDAQ